MPFVFSRDFSVISRTPVAALSWINCTGGGERERGKDKFFVLLCNCRPGCTVLAVPSWLYLAVLAAETGKGHNKARRNWIVLIGAENLHDVTAHKQQAYPSTISLLCIGTVPTSPPFSPCMDNRFEFGTATVEGSLLLSNYSLLPEESLLLSNYSLLPEESLLLSNYSLLPEESLLLSNYSLLPEESLLLSNYSLLPEESLLLSNYSLLPEESLLLSNYSLSPEESLLLSNYSLSPEESLLLSNYSLSPEESLLLSNYSLLPEESLLLSNSCQH
ncbi:hypothetical protein RRG08_049259 [Elysia crispata]|uniref:Uncharacterized protein n=1 Tax=Elysia crispata TaxID=231223 RepID=A0AAE1DJ91_9GAST|nr:hypothetical protein RRG08_049259 [Elysia crispata]